MASNRTKTGRLLNDTAQLLALPQVMAGHVAAGDIDAAWQMVMHMQALAVSIQPAINAELAKITEAERHKKLKIKQRKKKPANIKESGMCAKVSELLTSYTHLQLADQIGKLAGGDVPSIGAVIKWSLNKKAPGIRHCRAINLLHDQYK